MSRIGKAPIPIPDSVKVSFDVSVINVDGPKGSLNLNLLNLVGLDIADSVIYVKALGEDRKCRAMHGLFRSLINNMVIGVTTGFTKSLEIVGVGYRAEADKQNLTLNVGYYLIPKSFLFQKALRLKWKKIPSFMSVELINN